MGQLAEQDMTNRRGIEAESTRMGRKREATVPFPGFCWGPVTHSKVPLPPKVDQYCSAQSGPCSITKPNEVAYIPLLCQATLEGSTKTDTHGLIPQKACSSLSLSVFLSVSLSLSLLKRYQHSRYQQQQQRNTKQQCWTDAFSPRCIVLFASMYMVVGLMSFHFWWLIPQPALSFRWLHCLKQNITAQRRMRQQEIRENITCALKDGSWSLKKGWQWGKSWGKVPSISQRGWSLKRDQMTAKGHEK